MHLVGVTSKVKLPYAIEEVVISKHIVKLIDVEHKVKDLLLVLNMILNVMPHLLSFFIPILQLTLIFLLQLELPLFKKYSPMSKNCQ
jgi:hypothetical protein